MSRVGRAFNCGEASSLLMLALGPALGPGDELKRVWGEKHAYNEWRAGATAVRVDGWIGPADQRVPVLSEDAFDFIEGTEPSHRTQDAETRSLESEFVQRLSGSVTASPQALAQFEILAERQRSRLDEIRSKGFAWDHEPHTFPEKPLLKDSFRDAAREGRRGISGPGDVALRVSALHRAIDRRGLPFTPAAVAQVLNAGATLVARSSAEHADRFSAQVCERADIDPAAFAAWLSSERFRSWEVFTNSDDESRAFLASMERAVGQMNPGERREAGALLKRRLPALGHRWPALRPALLRLHAMTEPQPDRRSTGREPAPGLTPIRPSRN